MKMPAILLTNDDGVQATGIKAVGKALGKHATVYTVAPDRERSASSHSLTIHRPLRVVELGPRTYSISGTPTDCVTVGVEKILTERPALVVSGINHGPNLGDDISYSGTVSAAIEGTILNIPSFAVSLDTRGRPEEEYFDTAAEVASYLAAYVLEHALPYDTLLNVNVPNIPYEKIRGVAFTRQGKRKYEGAVQETVSPWGETYYWIGGGRPFWEHAEDTDINAVQEGYVSITPLHLDFTNHGTLDFLKDSWMRWDIENSEK